MSLEWHNQLLEHLLEANGMMVEMFRRSGGVKPLGRKIEPAIYIDPNSMNAQLLEFGHQSGCDISFAGAVNSADGSQYTLCWKYRRAFIEDRLCHQLQLTHGLLRIVFTGGAATFSLTEALAASPGRHSHEGRASGHKTVQVIAGIG